MKVLNPVKKYFTMKGCSSTAEMARTIDCKENVIQHMIIRAIPEARKIDAYLYVYSLLPVKFQSYIIKDLVEMECEAHDDLIKVRLARIKLANS